MSKMFLFLTFSLLLSFSSEACTPGQKFCTKCHPLKDLCVTCENPVFTPDSKGGCTGLKKCEVGKNYCSECSEEDEGLCITCMSGFKPDSNGGCSNTENCEVSFRGVCNKCNEGFYLIGSTQGPKFCKPEGSEDFLNCQEINYETGYCKQCEEGFFLNDGDKQCTETENCHESVYGKCVSCKKGFYLDHKDKNICKVANEAFTHCIESEDGKVCSVCEGGYYFDEKGVCSNKNYCSESENFECKKCIDGYFFTNDLSACTEDKNCNRGDKDLGVCSWCNEGFYLDAKDGKCKSNQEEGDDLKFCKFFTGEKCTYCEVFYYLSADGKCSPEKMCAKVENGICTSCIKGYYLGEDQKCSDIEHCIKSGLSYSSYPCLQCEDKYYFSPSKRECKPVSENKNLENCKISDNEETTCYECLDNFYLNVTNNECYDNSDKKSPLYKCAFTYYEEDICGGCVEGFYLGSKDYKCTEVEDCARSEDQKCKECTEEWFCLDQKINSCVINDEILSEETKFYFRCNRTNSNGDKCEECQEGLEVSEEGLCVDKVHCEEKNEEGECIKCGREGLEGYEYTCLNKVYGCVISHFNKNCLRCDNDLDVDECTECEEGYFISNIGKCEEDK